MNPNPYKKASSLSLPMSIAIGVPAVLYMTAAVGLHFCAQSLKNCTRSALRLDDIGHREHVPQSGKLHKRTLGA